MKPINMKCLYCDWMKRGYCSGKAKACKKFGTKPFGEEKRDGGNQ